MRRTLAIFALLCAASSPAAVRAASEPKEPVTCTVSKHGMLEMWEEDGEKIALGIGGVVITKGTTTLEADRIVVWSGKVSHCYAEGNVVLTEPGTEMRGDALIYDLDARKGRLVSPKVAAKGERLDWHVSAPEVTQIGPGRARAMNAWISTCGFKRPHWRFQAREITLHANEKIEAKHLTAYFGSVPVFYLPYFIRDLKHDWPWIRYDMGKDSDYGLYFFGRVGFDLNEKTKLVTGTDYREDWGWGWPLILSYNSKSEYYGMVDLYYIDEWNRKPGRPYWGEKRYRAKFYHRHRFAGEKLTIDTEYERYSDDTFMTDYFEKEVNTDKEPETYMYVRSAWEDWSITGLGRARTMDFLTQTEYMPEIDYRLMSRPIARNWAYLSYGVRAANLRREYDEDLNLSPPRSGRLDARAEVHVPFTLARIFEIDPFFGARQTWYEKSQNEEDDFWRGAVIGGVGLGTVLSRAFDVKNDFLRIDGLRHVVIPRVRFTSVTNPRSSDPPFIFDEVDELAELEIVNMSLINRLQSSKGPARDFLYLKLESEYFPRDSHARQQGMKRNWGDVEGTLRVLPHPRLSLSQSLTYDSDEADVLKGSTGIVLNPAAYAGIFRPDYEGKRTITSSSFEPRGMNSAPSGWSLGYSNSYARDRYSSNVFSVGGP
ncbi:LPS-assembly protein LptD, partial [Planctomycetota bacterium]